MIIAIIIILIIQMSVNYVQRLHKLNFQMFKIYKKAKNFHPI